MWWATLMPAGLAALAVVLVRIHRRYRCNCQDCRNQLAWLRRVRRWMPW
jgi:hypothetical protein